MSAQKGYRKGFTLIEVVIAIALGALILLATSSLLMSIMQLWVKEDKLYNFQGHVHGVKTFLKKHLKEANYKVNDKLPAVQWAKPPRVTLSINETLLSFYVKGPHPLFSIDNSLPVICYLKIDKDKGFSIIYHSFEKPNPGKEQAVYEVEISPWAKHLKLHYYNDSNNTWEVLDQPKEVKRDQKGNKDQGGKFALPDFIEIQFEKEGEENQSSFIPLYPKVETTEALL